MQTLPPLPPSSPILSIPFSLEIDPLGIYHLSLARHALDSGFTAAWGQYSCVCHCENSITIRAFSEVNFTPNHVKFRARCYYFAIVTNRVLDKEGRCHPQQKDTRPLPQTPPNTPAILWCCQETSRRDIAYKRSLELCASIVLIF